MKFEFNSKVRYSEVNEQARLTIGSLVNYFQDVSTFQSEALGIGIEYLEQNHLAWILSSWQIVIDHLPKLAENVTAQTWAYDFKTFYGYRNFALLDGAGEMAAWANSIWVLFNTKEQKPVRVPAETLELYGMEKKLDMDYAPRKMSIPKGGSLQEPFAVSKHHLDTNHHVNNGQYIAMASEYLPEHFKIGQVRVEYRQQARLMDVIEPVVCREEGNITVILNNQEGKPYAAVEFLSV